MNLVYENKDKLLNFTQKEVEGNRICISPWANRVNSLIYLQDSVHNEGIDFIKYYNENYKVKKLSISEIPSNESYIIPVGLHESPDTWAGYDGKFSSIFNLINETYLRHLQEGRAYLLLDNSLEGYHTERLFDFLYDESKRLNIPTRNIIFTCGNSELEKRAEEWSKANDKECIQVFGYSHFEFDTYSNSNKLYESGCRLPDYYTHIKYKTENSGFIKTYNFLNRKPRMHRIALYSRLFHSGLLPKGLISMNPWVQETLHERVEIDGKYEDVERLSDSHRNLPISWNGTNNLLNPDEKVNRFNEIAMLRSWFSVISETHFRDGQGTVFISEKTFKAIACCHPFIILGAKGSLSELKKLGYYTYSDFFNEDYDNLDNEDRLEAIQYEIMTKCGNDHNTMLEMLGYIKSRLVYNQKLLEYNSLLKPPQGFYLLTTL